MHARPARHLTGVVLAVSLTIGPAALQAQSAAQAAATCTRPPNTCPPQTSGLGFTTLSIINADEHGVKTCKFADHRLDRLETYIGSDGSWQLCNACDLPAEVVLDTWDDSAWGSHFEATSPLPNLDGSVSTTIGCHDTGAIDARRAKDEGRFNYKAHVRLTATSSFSDTIDPQLQIKRGGGLFRKMMMLGAHLLSLLLGVLLGYLLGRRRQA